MRWITVSIGEMTMIAYPRVVRCERFLAHLTTRRAMVQLPLFFRQCFQIRYFSRDVLSLGVAARTTLYSLHHGTDTIMSRTYVEAYVKHFM